MRFSQAIHRKARDKNPARKTRWPPGSLAKPKTFSDRRTAEKFYLPSLLAHWPDARVIDFDGSFIIATPDGFSLTENDFMEKIFNRSEVPCAR